MLVCYNSIWFDSQKVSIITTNHTWTVSAETESVGRHILTIHICIQINGITYIIDEIVEKRDKRTKLTKEDALSITKDKVNKLSSFINKHCKEQSC